jgi:hypothetical protein
MNQTLIFVTQEARQVDRNIASSANVVLFKNPGILQHEFERPELGKLMHRAKEAFSKIEGDRQRWTYVYAPDSDFLGLLENGLPSFWSSKLSRLFAVASSPSPARPPKRITREHKKQKARDLRSQGASIKEISMALGVSVGTAYNYLKDYPYGKDPGE